MTPKTIQTYDVADIADEALHGLLAPDDWEPTAERIARGETTARDEAEDCARAAESTGIRVSSQTIDTLALALERAADRASLTSEDEDI